MARKNFIDFPIQTSGGSVICTAECASDHEGKAVFAVYGRDDEDRSLILQYSADVATQLRDDFTRITGLPVKEINLFLDRGTERMEGIQIEYGEDGAVSRAVPDPRGSMSIKAIDNLSNHLHARDVEHQTDLSQHSFNPKNRPDIPR